jgi:hypothetical protein
MGQKTVAGGGRFRSLPFDIARVVGEHPRAGESAHLGRLDGAVNGFSG